MPNLAQLQRKSAPLDVEIGGATVHVEYRPERFTLGTIEAMQDLGDEGQVKRLVEILMDLLISWDITDDDGTTLMISESSLRVVPMQVLTAIQRAIAADVGEVKNGHRR